MTMLQLDPPIPVWVSGKGEGYALGWIDYSQEHHIIWIIGFDDTGEIWSVPNPQVRLQKNFSMERTIKAKNEKVVPVMGCCL